MDLQNTLKGIDDVQITEHTHKHGRHSLQWNWKINTPIQFDLTPQFDKMKEKRKACGVHFWIHQKIPINTDLIVTFHNDKGHTFSFRVNLDFQNWRAVARMFSVTKQRRFRGTKKISFEVHDHDPNHSSGTIYLDLIRVSKHCMGWAYDFVNTPQILLPFGKRNEIGGIEDLNGKIFHYLH